MIIIPYIPHTLMVCPSYVLVMFQMRSSHVLSAMIGPAVQKNFYIVSHFYGKVTEKLGNTQINAG